MLKKYWNTKQVDMINRMYFFDSSMNIKDCIIDGDTVYFLVDRMPKFRIKDLSNMMGKKLFFLVDDGLKNIYKRLGIEKIEVNNGKVVVKPRKIPKPILLLILRNYDVNL